MGAAVFTSGPYIEMAISPLTPMTPTVEDGVVTWRVPLGEGAVAHVALDDCGYYVRWLFDHPDRSDGMDLEVAIEHSTYKQLAAAFEKVTGHPAQYIDTDLDTYWDGPLGGVADTPAGYNADPNDKSTMSFRDNFTGFWNIWKYGIIERDYALLDAIHPNRISSVEQWFAREDKLGRHAGRRRYLGQGSTTELESVLRNPQKQRGLTDGCTVNAFQMAQLSARVEATLFTTFAPQIIKHIKAIPPRKAEGLVADVYGQMKREFQLVPPVTLHAPIPELLAGVWGMLRESIVAGPVSRGLREVVCEGVSAVNQCSFCVDAHSMLLAGADARSTADAIRAGRLDLIEDAKTREVARWAFANRQPDAEILRQPPFTAEEAPEIIASAACFHYIDRLVRVFLPDGPVPLPSKLRWLRGTTIRVAGSVAGRRIMGVEVNSGGAVGSLPLAKASTEFDWTTPRPALAAAFGSLEAVIEGLGQDALVKPVQELVQDRVAAWRGEAPGISRSWVEEAVQILRDRDRAAGRLALLVAIAPYQIDEGIIAGFRHTQPSDADFLAVVSWASFTATRRISGWLSPVA